jgi:hypothetical protein
VGTSRRGTVKGVKGMSMIKVLHTHVKNRIMTSIKMVQNG